MIRITKQTNGLDKYEISIIVIGAMIVGLMTGFGIFGIQGVNGQQVSIDQYVHNVTDQINKTQKHMIDNYVENIKQEICPTLDSLEGYLECMQI